MSSGSEERDVSRRTTYFVRGDSPSRNKYIGGALCKFVDISTETHVYGGPELKVKCTAKGEPWFTVVSDPGTEPVIEHTCVPVVPRCAIAKENPLLIGAYVRVIWDGTNVTVAGRRVIVLKSRKDIDHSLAREDEYLLYIILSPEGDSVLEVRGRDWHASSKRGNMPKAYWKRKKTISRLPHLEYTVADSTPPRPLLRVTFEDCRALWHSEEQKQVAAVDNEYAPYYVRATPRTPEDFVNSALLQKRARGDIGDEAEEYSFDVPAPLMDGVITVSYKRRRRD